MSELTLNAITEITLVAGKQGTPGAPLLQLTMLYNPQADQALVVGVGSISWAIATPAIKINVVTGRVVALGFGNAERVLAVEGSYIYYLPTPQIGQITEQFSATFSIDPQWNGHGTFTYGSQTIANVPVVQMQQDMPVKQAA